MEPSSERIDINGLYQTFFRLKLIHNWEEEIVYRQGLGSNQVLPIKRYSTPNKGNAIWLISGIHGEEPAGPNALARNINFLISLGKRTPLVLFPLCNPLSYLRNWRYPTQEKWSKDLPNISVADSEHYLLDTQDPTKPRREKPVCDEARNLTNEILRLSQKYPPAICLDLHEDNMINQAYIYSYGTDEKLKKYLAKEIISTLKKTKIEIPKRGKTRFNEQIVNGVIKGTKDSSIDEFISSRYIFKKRIIPGPSARAAFVIETPANSISLEQRITAHSEVIKLLETISF